MKHEDAVELISTTARRIMIDISEANEHRIKNALIELGWTPPGAEDQIYAALDAEILKRQRLEDELDQAYEKDIAERDATIAEMRELLDEAKAEAIMPKWVSVNDRLPEKEEAYLVQIMLDEKRYHGAAIWFCGRWDDCSNINVRGVTHWLDSIPPAPEV